MKYQLNTAPDIVLVQEARNLHLGQAERNRYVAELRKRGHTEDILALGQR